MATITDSIDALGQVIPKTSIRNTDYEVARWVTLSSHNGAVFTLLGSHHDVAMNGLASGRTAIHLGSAPTDTKNRVVVNATGDICASAFGVLLDGAASELVNRGDLWGYVVLQGSDTSTSSGQIRGEVFMNIRSMRARAALSTAGGVLLL